MTDTTPNSRSVPRWLHIWAIACVLATFLMLLVGQMVTSFRAGMADPVWPTEPWYLFSNYKFDLGYLIEHSHRIIGFAVGMMAIVLALGLWLCGPSAAARWAGVVGLALLIGGYGEFHRGMIAQRDTPAADVTLPPNGLAVAGAGLALVLGLACAGLFSGSRGAGLRILGVLALVGVMIQGLLGGFRVKLNELVGTDLAAVHGVFAQVVFGLLVSLAVLTARSPVSVRANSSIRMWSVALVGLLFIQVIWGAMIRHDPNPLTQRLHFLTAFLATAAAVWVLRAVFADPAARLRVRSAGYLLCGLLIVQLYLGVEAWMEKFGAYTLPELVPITKENAAIRTLHALIGSMLLATSLGLAVRLAQKQHGSVQDGGSEEKDEADLLAFPSNANKLALSHSYHSSGDAT